MTLRMELLADGGIRVDAPGQQPGGLASLRMAKGWVQLAGERGWPVEIAGDMQSPLAKEVLEAVRRDDVPATETETKPEPWPKGWTSLQIASSSGLDEQVQDLTDRGASVRSRRRDHSPYRLAMQRGHVGVMRILRDAGAPVPPGSSPPDDLPGAVVLRTYLPEFTRWFAMGAVVLGVAAALLLQHWAFLLVAAFGVGAIVVANAAIGRTRIAIDGPRLSVRQVRRWDGPVDLRNLVAVGFIRGLSTRMSSRWRLVQTQAGPAFGPTAHEGFDPALLDDLRQRSDLRVVTLYCGRGFLSPGFERHLAAHVLNSPARISTNAQSVFDGLGIRRADLTGS